jgi:hypothetical protein
MKGRSRWDFGGVEALAAQASPCKIADIAPAFV